MTLGIFLKGFNSYYFGKKVELAFEVIPQLILLMVLFGFMDLLIVAKWLTDYQRNPGEAPSVIATMINMFLNLGEPKNATETQILGPLQPAIIKVCLVLAIISVPTMLLVKPLWLR